MKLFKILLKFIFFCSLIPMFGLPIYWAITGTGLYDWLVRIQFSLIDGYYPIMTGFVSFIIVSVINILFWTGLYLVFPLKEEEENKAL